MDNLNNLPVRPKRDAVTHGEWHIHAVLMVDGLVAETADHRLKISDARLCKEFGDTTRAIGLWLDDLAQRRLRQQRAAKGARRR